MSTRKPIEALESAKYFIKQIPVDTVGDAIIQRSLSRLWMAAPWTWSIGSGPGFNVETGVASYDVEYPTDWGYALKADLIVSDNLTQRPLQIVSHIEDADGYKGQPSKVYFSGPAGLVSLARVSPVPTNTTGLPRVTSLYKRSLPDYTGRAKYTTAVPFPDAWFYVFEEIVLWEAYRYGDNTRAGEAVVAGDKVQFSGQLAVAQAAIGEMRLREPLVLLTDEPMQKDPSK